MITLGIESIDQLETDGVTGIEVRSRRGPIGNGFWARRWMEFYDSVCDPSEMENGRRLARKSQVYQVEIQPGRLSAIAAEIRLEPFFPYLEMPVLEQGARDAIFDWVTEKAEITSLLFAGILPSDVQDMVSAKLMPPGSGTGGCTCDWNLGTCRHEVALHCIFAEYLDLKPWTQMELIGISYRDLCNHVRTSWGGAPVDTDRQTEKVGSKRDANFYGCRSEIPTDTSLKELSSLDVLERLGPPPFFPAGERNVKQTLEKLYDD